MTAAPPAPGPLRAARPGGDLAGPVLRRADVLHGRARPALRHLHRGLHLQLGVGELPRRARGALGADRPHLRLLGGGDRAGAADRLPARLRDRGPRQPALAAAAAVRGHRAVLHHLPDPDDRLEDDPRRRQPDRRRAPVPRHRPRRRPGAGDQRRRDRRADLQLPAVHDPADLRQPRAARPEPDRGGQGPVRVGEHGVPEGDAAADRARDRRRRPAHLHPGVRRLRQRAAARQPEPVHDRQPDPVALPERPQLPGGRRALVPDDGGDPDRGPRLHPLRRHRGVHGRGGGGRE